MRQRLRVLTKCRQTYAYSTFPLRHSAVLAQGVKLSYFQNGLLKIDFTETNKLVKLKVISTWRDDCEIIESSIEDLDDFVWMNDEASRLTSILFNNNNKDAKANSSSDSSKDINLTLSIPEYCNLEIKGNNMDFIQEKKIQGDVDVDIKKGNIFVNKVRGQLIRMQAWNGNINVKTAIEGNVKLTGKEIAIKMMNVDSLNLHAHKLNVEAIYSKSAEIVTYGDTEINHMQGRCNITSTCGDLSLSGIEGRFVAQAHEGDITLQINRLHASGHASVGEKSRSDLTQDSSATASKGSIFAQIAPSVTAHVTLESTHSLPGFSMPAVGEEEDTMSMVTVEATSLTSLERNMTRSSSIVKGLLIGQANSPKVSSRRKSSINSGKINVQSHNSGAAELTPPSENGSLNLKAAGFVRLEALSWMDSIKRRHGLDEKS